MAKVEKECLKGTPTLFWSTFSVNPPEWMYFMWAKGDHSHDTKRPGANNSMKATLVLFVQSSCKNACVVARHWPRDWKLYIRVQWLSEKFKKSYKNPSTSAGTAWKQLHADFAGFFYNSIWLILVDAQTKWPEVIQMKSTTASKTIEVLRSLFSRFGILRELVSDNGPQSISEEYKQFCEQNGIWCILVAPYHPSSNGEVETFVQTFKAALRKADQNRLHLALT